MITLNSYHVTLLGPIWLCAKKTFDDNIECVSRDTAWTHLIVCKKKTFDDNIELVSRDTARTH